MHGDADGAGLIGDGAGDGLTNPPSSVGGELKTLGVVELFNSLDQTQITLLNQIEELHTTTHVTLGDGDHQTQVGLGQTLLSRVVALDDAHSQCGLLLGSQQRHAADLLEVHLNGVVDGDLLGGGAVVLLYLGFGILDAEIQILQIHVGKIVHHLDAVLLQLLVQLVHLLGVKVEQLHGVHNLLSGQLALAATQLHQIGDEGGLILFDGMLFGEDIYLGGGVGGLLNLGLLSLNLFFLTHSIVILSVIVFFFVKLPS